MKRFLAFTLVAIVLALPTGQVTAASAANAPTTASLQKQVNALKKTVNKLKSDVNDAQLLASAALFLLQCETAATADAFQGTWSVMDQVAGRTIFGPQAPISDFNACQRFRTPINRSFGVPPTTAVFSAINALIGAYAYT